MGLWLISIKLLRGQGGFWREAGASGKVFKFFKKKKLA